ncbi:MAG: signal peptidase I [Alphaproteobacteria bacterium]|nr:signal peptidase I [Alphaproteobacteria bacterium]
MCCFRRVRDGDGDGDGDGDNDGDNDGDGNDGARRMSGWLSTLRSELVSAVKTFVIALVVLVLFHDLAFEPFWIPSGSMYPTLMVGDYIFVSKYSYGYSRNSFSLGDLLPDNFFGDGRYLTSEQPVSRGDVVVFEVPGGDPEEPGWVRRLLGLPGKESTTYVKRVIGLPGDRIQVRSGLLHINDVAVRRERVGEGEALLSGGVFRRRYTEYVETLPDGFQHPIWELTDGDSTPPFDVPEGHYFMMGDNRDNSQDSRALFGAVPLEQIIGPSRVIFFSRDTSEPFWKVWLWAGDIRFSRLFMRTE